MWSGISSYLFRSEKEIDNDNEFVFNTVEDDEEWLYVEVRDLKPKEKTKSQNDTPNSYLLLPDVVLQTNDTKQKNPISNEMDESWYITPPSCFTIDSPVPLETSPLENLLIEHPSMSVYGSKLPSSFKNYFCQNVKMKSNNKDEIDKKLKKNEHNKVYSKCSHMPNEENYHIKQGMPYVSNKTRTDLIENIENFNPGQQAKWIREQKQLQRSFLNRINRVHHYQTSPKHPRRKDRRLKHSGINNHNY
ncbi:tumor protein p53-inducible nuclear protein 1-like [Centruroides sculpturatus]|uniref:tumor protein p53-inducible nuclear protein 1-like n=1 Tax=Centruroides sculpturatus TaxID=218467 RepID=UPI000C6D958B|nr:tumor protein p53-inducible nuclear protein 1-like [Centruroides sculpturatus]